MGMIKNIFVLLIFTLISLQGRAQELRATVKILSPEVQATNKDIFQTLETSIENFLNGYAFTDHKYSDEERIECNYIMTVNSLSGNRFDATLQVQYSRPVYNSNYNSPVLKVLDKEVVFSYQENEPIDFQQNTYTTNLSSILAFYAYTIIGTDRTTFKANGGDNEFAIAQNIVTTAQSGGGASGWKSFDGTKNRFWISDALMSPVFEPLKECWYLYHRQGLDLMYKEDNHEQALNTISTALQKLNEHNQKRPNSFVLNIFFDAKHTEIVNIFSQASNFGVDTKSLQSTLETIDQTHSREYENLGTAK